MNLVATAAELLSERLGLSPDLLGENTIQRALDVVLTKAQPENIELMAARLQEDGSEEWQTLVDEVVVPETWFFRHRESYRFLAAYATEKWSPAHPVKSFQVLCVPCASGEEPYSIAMALLNAGLGASRIQIDAADVSERLLGKARLATYGKTSFREEFGDFRGKYFYGCEEGWRVKEEVVRLVRFEKANLLDLSCFRHRAPYDVIFCRNALIYLNESARHEIVSRLRDLLDEEGLIFTGSSELTHFCTGGFVPLDYALSFACRKGQPKPARDSRHSLDAAVIRAKVKGTTATRRAPPPDPNRPAGTRQSPLPLPRFQQAEQHADRGDLDGAIALCERLLEDGVKDPQVYALLGVINESRGAVQSAEEHFRKALYLAPDHYESLLHMSLLCELSGNFDSARLYRARARRALLGQEGKAVLKDL